MDNINFESDIVRGKARGLYIHWPYCVSLCPYCDFNRKIQRDLSDSAWKDAVIADLRYSAEVELPPSEDSYIASVFFGGGTPSLAPVEAVAEIIAEIRKLWRCSDSIEITLEANPTSVETDKFADFAAMGVNRLSLGVQSLRDESLQYLGRNYDVETAKKAIAVAVAHFQRVNLDFIYGRTAEDDSRAWLDELREICAYGAEHLSLYQLTLERGTAFYQAAKEGRLHIPDADKAAYLFESTKDFLQGCGYGAYEVSNFAKAGAECRHNLIYWHYGLYAGIGAGAHGRVGRVGRVGNASLKYATSRPKSPISWAKLCGEAAGMRVLPDPLSPTLRFAEKLMMGLRLYDGVALESLRLESSDDYESFLSYQGLQELQESGYIRMADGRVSATDVGILCLNSVLERLLQNA